ncbi:conserved hypothetical protein [Rubrivivax sp. A210]|uniref:hypothetical protein n=1 Tax=Rubrivivax sp. A210 TaxID=2772301 RepID=UPI00191B27E0|nr:hypothetical protein [Rubrivivax sp. A210]CAD5371813.1 conserved hypothetical protein [Rubrivivax sp. A210]
MLRALAAGLLLANLVFFGWTHGWYAPGWQPPRHGEREPERLAAQVRPESVNVLPPKAASAALSAARAAALQCLEAGPLGEAELAAAEAVLEAAQLPEGRMTRDPVQGPPGWLVFAGRYADATLRQVREDELRKLGINFESAGAGPVPAELAPGLVLSRHSSREAAEAAMAAASASAGARLRGVRVVQLPPPPLKQWLRINQIEPELAEKLRALPAAELPGGFRPCAAARS